MDSTQSLSRIRSLILDQLKRADIATGVDYLTAVTRTIELPQKTVDAARDGLRELVAKASAAFDIAALRTVNAQVAVEAQSLFLELRSVPMLQEFCTVARDAIVERTLELSRHELYFSGTSCEVPLALLSVGSDGRKEQMLYTDQDYLFLYGSGSGASVQCQEEISDYFGMLGSVFAAKLEEVGISRCSGGIMPVNEDWRGTTQQWQERLAAMLRFSRNEWERDILNVIALMDARFICGDRDLGQGFGTLVRSLVRDNTEAIRHIARVVSSMKLSKGFLRRFIVEAEGDHKGEFNFKLLAWMPLVMCVRLLAVNAGIDETSTLQRITELRLAGHVSDSVARDLTDAYITITGHRIQQQIKRFKRIIDDDCYINPYELPSPERRELKNAVEIIDELQDMIRSRFTMTTSADRYLSPRL